jgi:hypothetical protein
MQNYVGFANESLLTGWTLSNSAADPEGCFSSSIINLLPTQGSSYFEKTYSNLPKHWKIRLSEIIS